MSDNEHGMARNWAAISPYIAALGAAGVYSVDVTPHGVGVQGSSTDEVAARAAIKQILRMKTVEERPARDRWPHPVTIGEVGGVRCQVTVIGE